MKERLFLILLAGGSSSRMGSGKKKEYMTLGSGTVLSLSLKKFLRFSAFEKSVIVVPEGQEEQAKDAIKSDSEALALLPVTRLEFVPGGRTRQESVFNALSFLHEKTSSSDKGGKSIVLIHDAARPFVTEKIIKDTLDTALEYGAAVPAISPVDTQKELAEDATIKRHLERSSLCAVQTPQAFLLEELFLCHKEAAAQEKEYTDDSEIWDAFPLHTGGKKIRICKGDVCNKKITYMQDMELAVKENKTMTNETIMRIGFGTDFHRLVKGRTFFLGGIAIPCDVGEEAHSDGDVLLHAITDSLLGAAAMGDIGSYFPSDDAKWKDADSKKLLARVWSDIQAEGWELNNIDCVVETEKPKFLPWRQKVIDSIAAILGVERSRIFVKAKTNEKLDAVGRGEAVKAYSTCLLRKC